MNEATDLAYGLEDRPPVPVALASAVQLVAILSLQTLNVLLIGTAAGLSPDALDDLLRASFLAVSIATVLQVQRWGRRLRIGSGFLAPSSMSSVFLPPAMLAANIGGMAMVCGMVVMSGAMLMVLSRLLHRLRALLPAELGGVVVVLLGLSTGFVGLRFCITPAADGTVDASRLDIAGVTLGCIVLLKVWGKGKAALFCAVIGVVVGYAAALVLGYMPEDMHARMSAAEWFDIPSVGQTGWRVDRTLIFPFVIASIASMVSIMATIITAQKVNDPDWVRSERTSIEGGVFADGLATVVGGLLGTMPVSVSSSCVSLSAATGVTSRRVAYAVSGMMLVLAGSPKLTMVFESTPQPVIGAVLLFSGTFVLINGIQIVAAHMLDSRRSMTVGFAFCIGLATVVYPELFHQLPALWLPLASSPLMLGTLIALALSALFRIGVRRVQTFTLAPDAPLADVEDFLLDLGAAWGARRDIMQRAVFAMSQATETVRDISDPQTPVKLRVMYDELRLNVEVTYHGEAPILSTQRPTEDEILEDDGHIRLAGFMLGRAADRVRCTQKNGEAMLRFEYDH
jgi:xanthine permease XanP